MLSVIDTSDTVTLVTFLYCHLVGCSPHLSTYKYYARILLQVYDPYVYAMLSLD